jgi:dUTPase
MHPDAKFRPTMALGSNGVDIPLQNTITIQKSSFLKVDLYIRFKIPSGYCMILMNKSSAKVKFKINIITGLIDVNYRNYLQVVIENFNDFSIQLNAGTAVAQVILLPCPTPKILEGEVPNESQRGSFGSTGQPHLNYLKFSIREEKIEHHPLMIFHSLISPRNFKIDNIDIKLFGSVESRYFQIKNFLQFENSQIQEVVVTEKLMSQLPSIKLNNIDLEIGKDFTYSENEIQQLLACDLLQFKKISIEMLIFLQDQDDVIK